MRINKYHMKIDLEIHTVSFFKYKTDINVIIYYNCISNISFKVTCPGVYLCASNGIELTVKTLGYSFKTNEAPSRFPLLYHESFRMDGVFPKVTCLSELEKILRHEDVDLALWQNGRRLAYYSGKIGVLLLNRSITCEGNANEFDNQILMKPSKCFPVKFYFFPAYHIDKIRFI